MEETQEISLIEIWYFIRDNFLKFVLGGIIGLFIAALITFFIVEPEYQSTTDIVVNDSASSGENQGYTQSGLQTNFLLLETYQDIIQRPIILEPVIEETGVDLSVSQLQDMITFTNDDNSLLFSISVTDEDPRRAAELANTIADVFQREVVEILDIENITVVSEAVANFDPVSPNVILNLLIGIILGAGVAFIIALIQEMTDTRLKSTTIAEEVEWTLLGTIPQMSKKDLEEFRLKNGNNNGSQKPQRRSRLQGRGQ